MEIPHVLLSCSSMIISSLSFHFSNRLKRAFQLAQNEDSRSWEEINLACNQLRWEESKERLNKLKKEREMRA